MTTKVNWRRKCEALAKKLGATLSGAELGEVNCEAPAGYIWMGEGVHELVNSPWDGETRADMWRMAFDRMDMYGIERCEQTDCEWCADRAREENAARETK